MYYLGLQLKSTYSIVKLFYYRFEFRWQSRLLCYGNRPWFDAKYLSLFEKNVWCSISSIKWLRAKLVLICDTFWIESRYYFRALIYPRLSKLVNFVICCADGSISTACRISTAVLPRRRGHETSCPWSMPVRAFLVGFMTEEGKWPYSMS